MRKVKIEELENCDGEEPRQVTKDDLPLFEQMKKEWERLNIESIPKKAHKAS